MSQASSSDRADQSASDFETQDTHLGFDYGSHRIGVSVGHSRLGTARPLATVRNHHGTPDWSHIDSLIEQWRPSMLIVGIPLTASGEEQGMSGQARGFMKRLQRRSQLPVQGINEAFSSNAAERELAAMRARGQRQRRIRRDDIDSMAATLILQDWFESQTATSKPPAEPAADPVSSPVSSKARPVQPDQENGEP